MFFHSFRKLFFPFYSFLLEVLKLLFFLLDSIFMFFYNSRFILSFYPISLWSDETTYYFFSSFYDLLFFSNILHLKIFFLPHYLFFCFFSLIQFYVGNFIFFFYLAIFLLLGFFLLSYLVLILVFFCLISFVLNFYDFLFKSNLAGLFLFSRDFLSVEDEDLWISSHIFYFDNRVIESRDFKIPLTSEEIEVFSTIIRIFFDIPFKNSEYYFFSNQLFFFKNDFQTHLNLKRDKGFDILDNIYLKSYKTKQLFPALTNFFSLFLTKTNFNDLKPDNSNSYLKKKINPRIYYPSFFNFFFRLINFIGTPTLKSKKLNIQKQKKIKRQYIKFKKKFSFKRYSKSTKLASPSFLNSIDNKISVEQIKINEAKLNFIINSNRNSFINHYKSIKANLEFFSNSPKISFSAFSYFRQQTSYNELNNKIKLQRFRRFFWISFPFYILEISNLFYFFFTNNKILFIFYNLYKSLLSKFLYILFWLFGDDSPSEINLLFEYNISNYNPNVKFRRIHDNLYNFIKTKNLSSQSILAIFQSFLNLDTYLVTQDEDDFGAKIKKTDDTFLKFYSLADDLKIILDSSSSLNSRILRDVKRVKKDIAEEREEYVLNFLNRKFGTLQKQNLMLSNKYVFLNEYNSKSYFSRPKIELIDFYKLLEYFYFVITNDINFYENAQFNARVEVLRQKYGQAIVNDMLDKNDHKQAKKVSVQLHIVDYDLEQPKNDSSIISNLNNLNDLPIENEDILNKSFIDLSSTKIKRKSISKLHVDNFIDDLILSYKYRFKK